ncbi:MAG: hydantoinase B/oxoprolinase family protein [Planctomycetes bacterium]|nr:hydantoinase B/oxoprolinase family protein [Planctomycetota bacterium]
MSKSVVDPVRLEVFHHLTSAFCEEAGTRLMQSAASPNIRERRDFSVAMFDGDGRLIAQAAHIPVHLGSAGDSVAAARASIDFRPGDVAILNDPYAGGTHLPDITMVRPVFDPGGRRVRWFLVNRAHHADVGGSAPGSMGIAADLIAEGLVLPPVLLRRRGELQQDLLAVFAKNVRGAAERLLDLRAQEASLQQLEARLVAHADEVGFAAMQQASQALLDYSERAGRAVLRRIGRGPFLASDELEDDGLGSGPLRLALRLERRGGKLVFDWRGTCPQARGGVNCNRGIVLAASVYALRTICPDRLPTNAGLFRLLEIVTAKGTLVDPLPPAPVAGGNVETSQRLVDVAFAALQQALPEVVPASSAGTMSNLTFGGRAVGGEQFSTYETLPGGAGASPRRAGRAAIQTHMTNTRNTPIEEFEHRYPLRVRELTVRRGSGGKGARSGGDGLRKVVEALAPVTVTFLGERHASGPPGAAGGGPGRPGRLERTRGGGRQRLPGKAAFELEPGDAVIVETPGGGAHGA